ncbi:MAG: acyltransferase [Clostridia bacterium]|nr:acyltransferase [Clostridia bacterium]
MNKFKKRFIQFKTDVERFLQYGDLPTSMYVKNGLKVGKRFSRQSGTRLDISNCWLIEIGDNVTLGNRVQLLAHDDAAEQWLGYRRVGRIVIGDNVFIGAGSTVLPGVTIGKNSIVGAGSLVTKSIPENSVAAGVPARVIKTLDSYLGNLKDDIENAEQEGRILDIQYDINCRSDEKTDVKQIEEGKNYYFKITRFCDQAEE